MTSFDWLYLDWHIDCPNVLPLHINVKETLAAIFSIYRYAQHWRNSKVIILTDNVSTKAAINKGASRNPIIMNHLRNIFWLESLYKLSIEAIHVPGATNIEADSVSRLRQRGHFLYWTSTLCQTIPVHSNLVPTILSSHVSDNMLKYFMFQADKLIPWNHNLTAPSPDFGA